MQNDYQSYGFSKTDDRLEKLLALNLEVAEKNGESVVGPWASDDRPQIPERRS